LSELPQIGAVVTVPAGEFLMGCDRTKLPIGGCVAGKDTPLHPVYLDAYVIDKYEVTNLQYRTCVNAKVCRAPLSSTSKTRKQYFSQRTYDYHPVLFVSQENARTYCQWAGGRLPTEAEWEKAARGPIDTRTWPWGEEFPNCERANFTDDRTRKWVICAPDTQRVGSHPAGASPYGAMDMAGNVFEWVQDRMDIVYQINYYAISPYANPPGPQPRREVREGPFYVIRGGSYRPRWRYARVFHRHHGHRGGASQLGVDIPLYRNDQVGFRCVRVKLLVIQPYLPMLTCWSNT
jgi:formylglycine-generating enzyme required for sulfatase activity